MQTVFMSKGERAGADRLNMVTKLKLMVRSLFHDGALASLYDLRKARRPAEQNRTAVTMALCGLLFLSCMSFLLASAWSRNDAESWLASRPTIMMLSPYETPWTASDIIAKNCESGEDCRRALMQTRSFNSVDPRRYDENFTTKVSDGGIALALWRTTVEVRSLSKVAAAHGETFVVSLPSFNYRRADLWVNGQFHGTKFNNGPLWLEFDTRTHGTQDLAIEVLFEISRDQLHFARAGLPGVPSLYSTVALMPLSEWRAFQDFLSKDSAGRGNFIGTIARIVMAVFVLVLFLIIDGSPETLGLGLFLGFEALAISSSYGWLPLSNVEALKHFSYQMGDIFRVYFFLQLARIADKRIMPWLIWGSAASILYGLGRQYGDPYNLGWLWHVPRARDFTAGLIGLVVCLRTARYLRGKGLRWRIIALVVAAIGAFEQFLEPATIYFPAIRDTFLVQTTMDLLEPIGVWMLAFSAFINISTLENRVKMLSTVAARAKEMENEMELGRKVQQAFLNLPKLPPEIRFECHHEAMLYVSGDTYFVDWNEQAQKLTFLINDVTGHGVQAALKASGVSVIANTIWTSRSGDPWQAGRLARYGDMVSEFFSRMDETPDVLAMCGAEFDATNGKLTLYRVNFPFPILVEPKRTHWESEDSRRSDNWRISILPIKNASLTDIWLTEGAFVVLTSDGYLDDSRRVHEFLKYMRKHIGPANAGLAAEEIKKIILSCRAIADRRDDDRTMTIFQWRRDMDKIPNREPRSAA